MCLQASYVPASFSDNFLQDLSRLWGEGLTSCTHLHLCDILSNFALNRSEMSQDVHTWTDREWLTLYSCVFVFWTTENTAFWSLPCYEELWSNCNSNYWIGQSGDLHFLEAGPTAHRAQQTPQKQLWQEQAPAPSWVRGSFAGSLIFPRKSTHNRVTHFNSLQ